MTILARISLFTEEAAYNQTELISQLRSLFPTLIVLDGDQLAKRAEHAEKLELSVDDRVKMKIVNKLRTNAKLYGPAIAVEIPTSNGLIKGRLRPRDIAFTSTSEPDPNVWNKVVDFCRQQKGELVVWSV